jgi:hypothetical protein
MPYSLQQAAQAAGINRSTVLRAIKAGRVSGTKTETGDWQIEPAELHRVYPPAEARPEAPVDACIQSVDASTLLRTAADAPMTPVQEAQEMLRLGYKLEQAENALAALKLTLDDVKLDRDAWRALANRLALPAPAPASRWRWWRRASSAA